MAIDEAHVRRVFAHVERNDRAGFLAHVADDVDWTVYGTHPLAGHYTSKQAFTAATYERLRRLLKVPNVLTVRAVTVAASGDMAAVELHGHGVAHNGEAYDNDYCWLTWWRDGRIVRVRAYLDSVAVQRLVDGNERPGADAQAGAVP